MTDNHSYNTPSKGTTDWHVPLNENFETLDTDVEIRDTDGNKGNYTPKQDALYRATDTGNVYLGDGSNWNKLNPPSESSGSTSTGTVVASPGNVQSELNRFEQDSSFGYNKRHVVVLDPNQSYDDSSESFPWRIPRGVILNFNGADVYRSQDSDTIHMDPDSHLWNPRIRTTGTNYSSNVIKMATSFDGAMAVANAPQVHNLQHVGNGGEGTTLKLLADTSTGLSDAYVTGFIHGTGTAVDLEARKGWVNGNWFRLNMWKAETFIEMYANGGEVSGNQFDAVAQPTDGVSNWFWDLKGDNLARFNNVQANVWDARLFANSTLWHIGPNVGIRNTLVDRPGFHEPDKVVDEAGRSSNVLFNYYLNQVN